MLLRSLNEWNIPQYSDTLEWDNQLTDGIRLYAPLFSPGWPIDLVRKRIATISGDIFWTEIDAEMGVTPLWGPNQVNDPSIVFPFLTGDNFSLSVPFSVSLWMKPVDDAGNRILFSRFTDNDNRFELFLLADDNIDIIFGNLNTNVTDAISPAFGIWQQIIVTYDGSDARGYLNGVLVSGPTTITDGGGDLGAGTDINLGIRGAVFDYSGQLAQIGVWNGRALSDSDVDELYDPLTRWDILWKPKRRAMAKVTAAAAVIAPTRTLLGVGF